VFLCRAEIYRFRVRIGWLSLSVLSFYRLLRLLKNFTLFKARTGDIVQLLVFVFENSEYVEILEKNAARLHSLECGDFDTECRLQNFPREKLVVSTDCISFNVGIKVSL
jgi:hypothetical protein